MPSYLNPANAVTASRFLTLPPFLYAIDHGLYQWALLSVIVCGVLDKVDGPVARLCDCKTEFGAIFDAIADGVCYAFMFLVLVAYGWVPWVPVVVILTLGALNAIFRLVYAKRAGRATNFRSIAMERTVGFTAYVCGFGAAGYEVQFYYYACMIVMIVVVLHDSKRMLLDPVTP